MKSNSNPVDVMAVEAVGPSDEDLNTLWNCCGTADEYGHHEGDIFEYARAVLARYGSAPRPVPVAERMPGDSDVDGCGQALWFDSKQGVWFTDHCDDTDRMDTSRYTHWLPAHALPIPTQENADD